jgi:hypothetical protein
MAFEFSDVTKQQIYQRQNGACAYCGERGIAAYHHVVPRQSGDPNNASHGWLSTEINGVGLCGFDHQAVHIGDDAEFKIQYKNGAIPPASYFKYAYGKGTKANPAKQAAWESTHARMAKPVWEDLQRRYASKQAGDLLASNMSPRSRVDPAALAQAAHVVIRNGLTQISLDKAGVAATNAFFEAQPRIDELRAENPARAVRLIFYLEYQPGVNADFNDTYKFHGLTMDTGGTLGAPLFKPMPRGQILPFVVYLPALDPNGKPLQRSDAASDPTYQTYLKVRRLIEQGSDGDYAEAFRVLSGCAMYDILRILNWLNKDGLFRLLDHALRFAAPGYLIPRLAPAFGAIHALRDPPGMRLARYKFLNAKEFLALPPDQQKDIEKFLTPQDSATSWDVVGRWHAKVHTWTWIYDFLPVGAVTWTDPYNGMTGTGSWKVAGNCVAVTWAKSNAKDEWNLPIDPDNQKGRCFMADGTMYTLKAVKEKK